MTRAPLLAWLAVAAGLTFLVGCGPNTGGPAGGKAKVAFVTNNPANFWDIVEAGARKAEAEEKDVELVFRRPSKGDTGVQKETIETIINQGPKAISISVINPSIQTPYINDISSKTTVFTVDTDAPDSRRVCFIGADNYEAGKAVGALVKEALPDGGTIALFIGNMTQTNSQNRVQGLIDELAGEKGQKTDPGTVYGGKYKLHKLYTESNPTEDAAKENAVNCLNEIGQEEKLCMVGLWAYNPPMILSAVNDKAKDRLGKIKIVGFDEMTATLEGIRDGHIVGTVSQQPFQYGYQSVKLMAAKARGQELPGVKDGKLVVEHITVTKDGHAVTSQVGGEKKHRGQKVEDFRKELDDAVKSVKK